jgi:hypothetical protein
MIEVRRTADGDPLEFEVLVREGNGETRHQVTISQETCGRLTAGEHTPERCLEAAFRFLLDREPKESILSRFDVTVISRYFPEFEQELPRYLTRACFGRRGRLPPARDRDRPRRARPARPRAWARISCARGPRAS